MNTETNHCAIRQLCPSLFLNTIVPFLLNFFSLYFLHPSITFVFVSFCKCELFLWKLNYTIIQNFRSYFSVIGARLVFAINFNVNIKVALIENNVILLIEYSILVAIPKCTHLLWSYYAFSQFYFGKMLSLWYRVRYIWDCMQWYPDLYPSRCKIFASVTCWLLSSLEKFTYISPNLEHRT